ALPQVSQVYHGKYARNEIYNLVPAFASDPGPENTTVTPIPGDVCYFRFSATELGNPGYGYREGEGGDTGTDIVDLAVFYGRNNLLINGDVGWIPGNVFAAIEEGLAKFAAACQDVWMNGAAGETLRFERARGIRQSSRPRRLSRREQRGRWGWHPCDEGVAARARPRCAPSAVGPPRSLPDSR